ncbi:peroxidase [Phaeobacter sp. 11ANDIMAR09]|uniref:Dyp-type peroxidase n=1 Tax=Phaeobacter sp. 11ANDIMAR09 TaxID=1225647 RepID=UPI0006C873A8|nr:peroxidase [Phaeobacter sp. 11ANDIMAR09]KPD13853.1 peroxidase [Phaeobacter sp. 11ANDIMAR09]
MTRDLNLDDIQGNVTRAYGRFSFPFARYFFFHFPNAVAGRNFVDAVRQKVTTAALWQGANKKPDCTTNVALTFPGLLVLQLPVRMLQQMPAAFIEGMKARAFILGDRDQNKTEEEALRDDWDAHWDPIWQKSREPGSGGKDDVHMLVTLNAQSLSLEQADKPHPALQGRIDWLTALAQEVGVRQLDGICKDGKARFQDASAVFDKFGPLTLPTAKEHLGFTDGIGDPVFEGQHGNRGSADTVIGRGKLTSKGWEPLATGEFILGHPDESQELPPTAKPPEFMHNGTFMAFRKLHENVGSFEAVLAEEAARYAKLMGVSKEEAQETLRAKMCGRWTDGVPLSKVPTYDAWVAFGEKMQFRGGDVTPLDGYKNNLSYIGSPEARDFRYGDDMSGAKCPGGAHMRRVNTRDYLDPLNKSGTDPATGAPYKNETATSALNKRRRILRRGLPYGPPNFEHKDDETEQGVIMLIVGTSLERQFEFVQQQWIQYGLDFHQGNNTCPMLGNHDHSKRHTIPSDPASGRPPYVMSKLKTFVECRGGDYFFIPSMTALRMIAMGIVDPT